MLRRIVLLLLSASLTAAAQAPASAGPAAQPAPMTPEQQQLFAAARADFGAHHMTDALAKMRQLHEQRPDDVRITEGTAETALAGDDPAAALSLLQPLVAAEPQNWLARTMLARGFAQSHQDEERDAQLKLLLDQHRTTTDPQFKQQTQFLLESVPTDSGRVDIYYSLAPWSRYNIYAMARVYNTSGQQVIRITLESADFDQPSFAKEHPELAAKGERMFSLDGYKDLADHTQTHYTFAFLNGQPTYPELRSRMLEIAAGKVTPMSSTAGIHPK